ncbi:MAG: hypothetical protein II953_01555, partial [Clostridia bacterium]|nr:hypothetical protein [Clostridia bacterium]
MKKILTVLLCLAMLLPLAACSETAENTDGPAAQSGGDIVSPADAETEDPTAALYADVPAGSYGGYTFSFLNNISNFAYTLMTAEEL